ncbi:hypothetical protein DVH24_005320 [Malus domestica]|uniref:Uncharacterized protein n=1 Tax=Malus domestica TaxID=3750 RepID=A0A498KJA5_MALDO|nr:hypothetical protein DVH24_005320 [Malus domestica]
MYIIEILRKGRGAMWDSGRPCPVSRERRETEVAVRRRTSDHQEDMIKDGGNEVLFNDQITKRRTTWSGFDSHALPHAQTHQMELSICLYPQHQLTNNSRPFFLAARLSLTKKLLQESIFSPSSLLLNKGSRISISTIPPESPLTVYLGLSNSEPWVMKRETVIRAKLFSKINYELYVQCGECVGMREDWVAKNAKQPAPKPEDMSVSSNNLVKDGARGSNTFLRWRKLLLKFPGGLRLNYLQFVQEASAHAAICFTDLYDGLTRYIVKYVVKLDP